MYFLYAPMVFLSLAKGDRRDFDMLRSFVLFCNSFGVLNCAFYS